MCAVLLSSLAASGQQCANCGRLARSHRQRVVRLHGAHYVSIPPSPIELGHSSAQAVMPAHLFHRSPPVSHRALRFGTWPAATSMVPFQY